MYITWISYNEKSILWLNLYRFKQKSEYNSDTMSEKCKITVSFDIIH